MHLKPLPVTAESMKPGKLYIWIARPERDLNDGVLVMLNTDRDGIVEPHEDDDWYFADELIGKLYGPITLLAE